MLDDDPFAPPVRKQVAIEDASIEDLEVRIERLRAEIALCERAIASKKAQRAAADAVFGGRPS